MTSSFRTALLRRLAGAGLLGGLALLAGCWERPPVEFVQNGPRGTAMASVYNPRTLAAQAANNAAPASMPPDTSGGPPAGTLFKNVQVLKDVSVGEFTRTMVAITSWVAPEQGCNYCHKPGDDLSADTLYTKVVARKMLEMTRKVNTDWKSHVAAGAPTGVTCYTCHRGQPVPAKVWFSDPGPKHAVGLAADLAGQNIAGKAVGLSSLPWDPNTPFLLENNQIRVYGTTALPTGNHQSIKQAEWTYALMMQISDGLGVNCTYCHNTQAFGSWKLSPPQRQTAYQGIAMARSLNVDYMVPLTKTFPANRLGPTGDVAKVNCATCHQGAYKPLNGAQMAKDHPALGGAGLATPAATAVPAAAVTPVAAATTALSGSLGNVLFASGKDALDAGAKDVIAKAIEALKSSPDTKVALSGYVDQSGNAAKNAELAKARAFAVRDALKAGGIDEARIALKKPEAVAAGASADARRVEINVAP